MPKAATIHVGKQKRNLNQSTYDVAIEADGTTSSAGLHRWLEILGGAALACALAIVAVRLRRRRRA